MGEIINGWPRWAPPIPVKDGLAARNRRGEIGDTWWSKRFIEILESFGLQSRLTRGRVYARRGQVVSVDMHRGEAIAIVQGSRSQPYRVVIGVDELNDEDWALVGQAFGDKAVFLAKLLAGDMPQNIEDAFVSCSLSLFPTTLDDLHVHCSCPDIVSPCKHIAATLYLLAESFDDDPFLIFEWRGRTKDELLALLRQSWQGGKATTERASSTTQNGDVDELIWADLDQEARVVTSVDDFWASGADFTPLQTDIKASAYPDVFLRQLEPLVHRIGNEMIVNLLAPAYKEIAAGAEALFSREVT